MTFNSKPIAAVIFDMDGTLIDSEKLTFDVLDAVNRNLAYEVKKEDLYHCIGKSEEFTKKLLESQYTDNFSYARFRADLNAEKKKRITEYGMPMKAGALSLVKELYEAGVPLGLATNTFRHEAIPNLEASGLAPYFSVVRCGNDVSTPKPHPAIYKATAAALSIDEKDCLVFEDSQAGVNAALGAGMLVVMIPDLIQPNKSTREKVYKILPSLSEAKTFFA